MGLRTCSRTVLSPPCESVPESVEEVYIKLRPYWNVKLGYTNHDILNNLHQFNKKVKLIIVNSSS